jgi:protein SCO1
VGALVVAAVLAFAIFEPVQVLPRIRIAPGFAFVDQSGAAYTSEDGRGAITLYNFAPADCGEECDVMHATMAEVGDRMRSVDLSGADFRRITVALDTGDPEQLAAAAADTGADGDTWTWVGAGESVLKEVVGAGFRVYFDRSEPGEIDFDPVFVIVDGTGLIRGEYRYASLVSDADRLTRHLSLMGGELRNADGPASLVYEAAHVFLCYP